MVVLLQLATDFIPYMTKAKALSMLRNYARCVVELSLATKLSSAFGKSWRQDLGIRAKHYRLSNSGIPVRNEKPGVAIYELSKALAVSMLPHLSVNSSMHGAGSRAEEIVLKSTAIIEAFLKEKEIEFEFLSNTDLSFFAKKRVTPQEAEGFSIKHNLSYRILKIKSL